MLDMVLVNDFFVIQRKYTCSFDFTFENGDGPLLFFAEAAGVAVVARELALRPATEAAGGFVLAPVVGRRCFSFSCSSSSSSSSSLALISSSLASVQSITLPIVMPSPPMVLFSPDVPTPLAETPCWIIVKRSWHAEA